MNNSDKRQEIKDILFHHEKTMSWLQSKLHTHVDLHYLLSDRSVNFDVNIYEEIMEVFKREGFISSEGERCNRFTQEMVLVNAIISHSTYLLNSNASQFIRNNVLEFREKMKLTEIITKMRNELNDELEKIEKIITQ